MGDQTGQELLPAGNLQGATLFYEPERVYGYGADLSLPVRLAGLTGSVAVPPGICWALDATSPEAVRQSYLNPTHGMNALPHFWGGTNAGV